MLPQRTTASLTLGTDRLSDSPSSHLDVASCVVRGLRRIVFIMHNRKYVIGTRSKEVCRLPDWGLCQSMEALYVCAVAQQL